MFAKCLLAVIVNSHATTIFMAIDKNGSLFARLVPFKSVALQCLNEILFGCVLDLVVDVL